MSFARSFGGGAEPIASDITHATLGHPLGLTAAAWSPDGQYVATTGADRVLRVWSAVDATRLTLIEGVVAATVRPPTVLAFAPDAARLVSGDKVLRVYDRASGETLQTLSGHRASVVGLAVGHDLVASLSGRMLLGWDLETGAPRFSRRLDDEPVSVCVCPDGQRLLVVHADGRLCVLHAASGDVLGVGNVPGPADRGLWTSQGPAVTWRQAEDQGWMLSEIDSVFLGPERGVPLAGTLLAACDSHLLISRNPTTVDVVARDGSSARSLTVRNSRVGALSPCGSEVAIVEGRALNLVSTDTGRKRLGPDRSILGACENVEFVSDAVLGGWADDALVQWEFDALAEQVLEPTYLEGWVHPETWEPLLVRAYIGRRDRGDFLLVADGARDEFVLRVDRGALCTNLSPLPAGPASTHGELSVSGRFLLQRSVAGFRLVDVDRSRVVWTSSERTDAVGFVSSEHFAIGAGREVSIRRLSDGGEVAAYQEDPVRLGKPTEFVAFADDARFAIQFGNHVRVRALEDRSLVIDLPPSPRLGRGYSSVGLGRHAVAADPQGRRLAARMSREIFVVDLHRGEVEGTLHEPFHFTDMAFSPSGDRLAVASHGGVRVWRFPRR